jgi:GntR family transcriptional regulator/MocR family aminotransferase
MARSRTVPTDESSWLQLEPAPGETLRTALARTLRAAIADGALRPGAELPSSRALATQLGVSRGVATDAIGQLVAQGFLDVSPRRPPVVASSGAATRTRRSVPPAPAAPRYDLTPSTPDVTLFPVRAWTAALRRATRLAPVRVLDYGDPRGDAGLREALANHLGRTRGVIADPAQIVLVQGTAQGLDLVLRVLRRRGKRRIAVEDPSLDGLHRRIEGNDLQAIPLPIDEHGVVVTGLAADAVLVTPAHQYPTGVVLSGERRRALIASGALVLEDDYDAEFRYDGEPVRALQGLDPEHVVYFGTVSKTLAPALRIGWAVLPDDFVDDVAETKLRADFCSPILDQLALRRLLESGEYDRHVRRVRSVYRARRDALVAALAKHLPELHPEGIAAGLHVLLQLPPGTDDVAVAAAAEANGVRVEALSRYAFTRRDAPGLVVGYGRVHETAIEPAISLLRSALRDSRTHARGADGS